MKYDIHIRLLRDARDHLPRTKAQILDGAEPNICAHLWDARCEAMRASGSSAERSDILSAWHDVSDFIEELLGSDALMLEHWLRTRGYLTYKQADDMCDDDHSQRKRVPAALYRKVQATRLAWIDWMIEQYSK